MEKVHSKKISLCYHLQKIILEIMNIQRSETYLECAGIIADNQIIFSTTPFCLAQSGQS